MHPELKRTLDAIDQAVAGMPVGDMGWSPAGKWSAAQVLEHLAIAFGSTAKGLERALAQGKPLPTTSSAFQRVARFLVVGLGYFPPGRKAPEMTVPKGLPPEEALRTSRENLEKMDEVLERCEKQFGLRLKIANHPVLGAFNVRQWRRFHRIHTEHHMKQIARLKEMAAGATPARSS